MDVVGTYAVNGVLSTINGDGLHVGSDAGNPIDLNVIARARPHSWANFQLRASYDPNANSCDYHGMILPARGP